MAGAVHRIVVVDDEADLRETIAEYLRVHGYVVAAADGGRALRTLFETECFDLAVLDIRMPEECGLSVARWLRARGDVAIIMVTAAGDVVDRVVGLEVGADDYVAKPIDLRELLARIRAVLRRRAAAATTMPSAASIPAPLGPPRFGAYRFDRARALLCDDSGRQIRLTRSEADLLEAFASNPDRVLSRDTLLDLARGKDVDPFDRSIDMRIARIRRKIETDPARPAVLRTVRGAGYIFSTRP
ncbi:MAG: response regulator [Alphaproteobacteria bacterium]